MSRALVVAAVVASGLAVSVAVGSSPDTAGRVGEVAERHPAPVGDLVVVFQSGAYGLTASPLAFLSHPAPGELLV